MRYKFRIYNDNGVDCIVNPLGDITISGEREDREFFYNQEISTLKFVGDDYKKLLQYESSFDEFFLEVCCNDSIIFTGRFTFLNASVCRDRCYIELDIEEDSIMNCLKRSDEEINILSVPLDQITTKIPEIDSNLEFYVSDSFVTGVPTPPDASWGQYGTLNFIATLCYLDAINVVVYAREIITETCLAGAPNPPSGGFIIQDNCSIDGTFTYAVPYSGALNTFSPSVNNWTQIGGNNIFGCFLIQDSFLPAPSGYTFTNNFNYSVTMNGTDPSCTGLGDINENLVLWVDYDCLRSLNTLSGNDISNSRRLDDVIEYLATNNDCEVNCFESEFFTAETNCVTGEPNELNDLLFHEKSDVTRANASQDATISEISLFRLYENLKEMFNLIHRVNENGCYEIEHVSKVLENKVPLSDLGSIIKNPCCYTVNRDRIPNYEEWEWREADGIDFIGRNIEYRSTSGNYLTNSDPITHDVSDVTTDLEYIYNAYDRSQNPVNDLDGFVITHNDFDGTNYIVGVEQGDITSNDKLNGHLSQANLHENYWRDYRYFSQGLLNSNLTTFNSTIPLKENDDIIIKACCPDFQSFDVEYRIIDLGDCRCGIIESYDYDLRSQTLTLKISII